MKPRKTDFVFLLLILLTGCSSDDEQIDLRGSWDALVVYDNGLEKSRKVDVTYVFDQRDDQIMGTFAGEDGSSGILEGSLVERALDLTLTQLVPCAGSAHLLATIANEHRDPDPHDDRIPQKTGFRDFAGTISGIDCFGDIGAAVVAQRATN